MRFGLMFASEIRRKRVSQMLFSRWRWHLDEVFVTINGVQHYLWRAVDHEGEVLKAFVTKTRDKAAAWKFLLKLANRHGWSAAQRRLRSGVPTEFEMGQSGCESLRWHWRREVCVL
jgi:transposase-like protein